MRRRTLLRGAAPLCAGLAGCSGLISETPTLSLVVFNHAESPYAVEVTVSRTGDGASRSEAKAFSGRIRVEADGRTAREDVAERRPSLIEYGLYKENSELTDQDHVHYYPGDGDESGTLAFDIDSPGTLTRR
jgi:hypothetical protein